MSQLQNVQPTYLPKMKEGETVTKRTRVLWIGFLTFFLVALVVSWNIPTIFPKNEAKEVASYSTNPELSIAGRYEVAAPASAEIDTFSANPELSVAGRYAVAAPVSVEINTFSANPELSVAGRYAVAAPVSSEIGTFSANPELMVARRYAEAKVLRAEGRSLYDNPELSVAGRYAVATAEVMTFRWNSIIIYFLTLVGLTLLTACCPMV